MTDEHARPWTSWPPGTRVVVRRRLEDHEVPASGEPLTDVIGIVLGADERELVLRRDAGRAGHLPHAGHGARDTRGEVVVVPVDRIVGGKIVPPRPVRRPAGGRTADDR
ncbi:hypothetical protein [Cellulosimicrobium arenosum]|uniref:Uncharacterized protein n=1 Tax=Cellulosimicrobium arenosum TaxID=2708133 RepID=A0A927G7F1_9MICO|nr:hypothetical protein [Cellulosimicrobium arenosum]MBD8078123.1 hypothetical protein [Cellulosimicrobium arenosum]